MATSGTITSAVTSWLDLKIVWTVKSQSETSNSSVVNVQVQLRNKTNGQINSSASKKISLTVNGTTYEGTCTVGLGSHGTKVLMSKDVTIAHTTDGSKTAAVSCSVAMNVTLSGVWVGTKTVSGSMALPKINRPSSFTRSGTAAMGSKQTINITRKSSSFTHKLKYTWAGETKDIASDIGTSYEWTPLVDMAAKIPNATSGSCKLTLETYSGGTLIGSASLSFTLSVPASVVPTISAFTLTEAVAGLAAQFGAFINTKSKIKYAVTASGTQGSTIKNYKVTVAGQSFAKSTATTGVISAGAGTKTATVTVTDSRGRTASKSVSYTVIGYTPPRFSSISVNRCDADHVLNEQGESLALKMAFVATNISGKNSCSYSIGYKLTTEDSYTALPFDFTGYSFNDTLYFTDLVFSTNNSYHVRVQLTDYFGTVEQTLTLYSSRPVFDILYSGSGFAFNKMAEVPDLLDVGYTTRFFGGVQGMPITAGTDFDTLLTPNIYHSEATAASGGYKNGPTTDSVSFVLEVLPAGSAGQVMQRFTTCSEDFSRVYVRHYYTSAWGEWGAIHNGRYNKLLWSGAKYMGLEADGTTRQKAPLAEPISKQPNGIVLIFSEYVDEAAADYGFQHFFVSKHFISPTAGISGARGSDFIMGNSSFNVIANKYLYFYDDRIEGNENNTKTGTGTSGITFTNNRYVLRYVVGV